MCLEKNNHQPPTYVSSRNQTRLASKTNHYLMDVLFLQNGNCMKISSSHVPVIFAGNSISSLQAWTLFGGYWPKAQAQIFWWFMTKRSITCVYKSIHYTCNHIQYMSCSFQVPLHGLPRAVPASHWKYWDRTCHHHRELRGALIRESHICV